MFYFDHNDLLNNKFVLYCFQGDFNLSFLLIFTKWIKLSLIVELFLIYYEILLMATHNLPVVIRKLLLKLL